MKKRIDIFNKIKNYFVNLSEERKQELLNRKNIVIGLLEKDWSENEIDNFNITLIGNSAGWLGGNYNSKDIKNYILRNRQELFTEEEVEEYFNKINGVKTKKK